MSENASSTIRSKAGIYDVVIFLILVIGINQAAVYFIKEQSLFAGLIGLLASIAIAWALLLIRGQRWRDVGLKRPSSYLTMIVWALLITVTIYFMRDFLTSLLGSEPNLERFAPLEGNLPLYLQLMVGIWITAALFEELIYRGFILNRLMAAFEPGISGALLAVLGQAVIFGAVHWYQGWAGVVLTGVAGFIIGVAYLISGRNLWPLIIAHGLVNSYGLTKIFLFGVS